MPLDSVPGKPCVFSIGPDKIPFTVMRSKKRRRTFAFRFDTDDVLRVAAPFRATDRDVEKILMRHSPWIKREYAARSAKPKPRLFEDGTFFPYLGFPCQLRITHKYARSQGCSLSNYRMQINIHETGLSSEGLRQEVRTEVLLWMKKRARAKFKKRLDFLAKKLGVRYRGLIVSSPQHRWGSCSHDNLIRLNWRLMMAPLPILDYVAAHELCHVKHKNHSPRFWDCLSRTMPDCHARRKAMRELEKSLRV